MMQLALCIAIVLSCIAHAIAFYSAAPLRPQSCRRDTALSLTSTTRRAQLFAAAASALVIVNTRARSADAFCGEPYPVWAYNLDFEEGEIPLKDGPYSGKLFIRVVGSEKKERKVKRSCIHVCQKPQSRCTSLLHSRNMIQEHQFLLCAHGVLYDPCCYSNRPIITH
jgi:hypothetical protein